MQNPEKIEIEGLKTIHKLCKFGADHNMEGCSFTEIVEHMFDELAKARAVPDLRDLQERIGGHQYYHDEHGHMIVDMDDVVKEISGFDGWKAQAVPEGFVLIKNDTKTVVAIERMVEQQVEASGMDSRRLERLDGWRIIEAAIEAQEPNND